MTNTPNDGGRTPPNSPASGSLLALVAKWREEAEVVENAGDGLSAAAMRTCADELESALRESLGGEGDGRRAIAWAVQTNNYGPCYSFSNEFLAAFPNAPVDYVPAPRAAEAVSDGVLLDRGFRYENGIHTPTVLVGFKPDDWDARDRFAAALSPPSPGAANGPL